MSLDFFLYIFYLIFDSLYERVWWMLRGDNESNVVILYELSNWLELTLLSFREFIQWEYNFQLMFANMCFSHLSLSGIQRVKHYYIEKYSCHGIISHKWTMCIYKNGWWHLTFIRKLARIAVSKYFWMCPAMRSELILRFAQNYGII